MIYGKNGLDLDFKETKQSLGIPDKGKICRSFSKDPIMDKIGKSFAKIDYKQYLTRFKWNNLPQGLDSELFERILDYSGSAMFFYIKELGKFYFLPYGMSGEGTEVGIDFYGRFKRIKPYSFNGSTDSEGESKANGKKSSADI